VTDATSPTAAPDHPGGLHVRGAQVLILAVAATVYALHEGAELIVPVLVSVLLAYALEPFVAHLVRWRLPRLASVIVVYVVIGIGSALVVRGLRHQVSDFLDGLPDTIAEVQQTLAQQADTRHDAPGFFDRLKRNAAAAQHATPHPPAAPGVRRVVVQPRRFDVRAYLRGAVRSVFTFSISAFIVGLLTFLLLVAGDMVRRKIVRLAGPRFEQRKITIEVIRAIDRQIERYLAVRLLISVLVAAGTGGGLWLLGVANPVVWGLIAGALNVLPFVGPGLAIGLITLAAFLQFKTIEMTAAAVAVSSFVAFVEGNVLTPWLAGRAGEVNTVAVFVAVLFWGWMWGVWGLLLAIPIMVAMKAAADRIEPMRPLGELLGR
jgi:predicted PurR-regulated permease PerM